MTLCDFSQPKKCGYWLSQRSSGIGNQVYSWKRWAGATATDDTGPSTDALLGMAPLSKCSSIFCQVKIVFLK